ncbi:MAG: hypothetical protein ACJ8J7_07990 [Sulfurifustaceae bacterium]
MAGRKQSTFAHLEELLKILDVGATTVTLQRYRFWEGAPDHPNPDVVPEAQTAAESGADLVIAKSIGTLVTMIAHAQFGFRPERAVFIGTPLRRYAAEDRLGALKKFTGEVPTLFIQQTDDFNGGFAALASALAGNARCTLAEVPGNDHMYTDARRLKQCIENWYGRAA